MVKVRPFETSPAMAQWGRTITYPDYNKMLQGFRPQSMDDKWSVYTDTPEDDGEGHVVVHAYFGVENHEHLCLTIAPGDPDETEARDWATITKISWKVEWPGGMQTDEEKAKELAITMCMKLLKCAMEN